MWELKMLSSAERQAYAFNSLQIFSWYIFKDSVNTFLLELQGEFVQTTVLTKCCQGNFSTSQSHN